MVFTSVISTKTSKRWIRAGAALASVAAVVAGSLVSAGSASAANRVVEVAPAPYIWSDSGRFGGAPPLPVPGDATTLTVELPDSSAPDSFTKWSHPAYRSVDWQLGSTPTDLATGTVAVDPATNSIAIPLPRTVDSFTGGPLSLNLTGSEDRAADAYAPAGVERTGFVLDLAAVLTAAPPSGSGEADLDLSAPTPTDRTAGGIFWAGGGTVTEAGAGDVIVLDSGVPGFFDLTGLSATVGTDDGSRLSAPTRVLNGGASVAVQPTQEFYDRYLTFGDTSPLGAPSVQVRGLSKGGEQPAGAGVVVRAPLRVVPATTPTPTPGTGPTVTRLAGSDRQGTAVEVSKSIFSPGVPVVYVATGSNFPDALSAGPAAAKQGGPLLLVDRDSMSQVVRDELTRLKPKRIVVVGSALSVGDTLATELAGYAENRNLIRLGGVDRYDTSRQIIQYAFGGGSSKAWLATGEKFPDALGASAAAGSVDAPVILVNGTLPQADPITKAIVSRLRVSTLTIAGSELSVSAGIQSSLTGPAITRIGGTDRYDTSEQLNRAAFRTAKTVFLATGENFPDALSGATAAGYANSPLFAVQPTCVPAAVLNDIKASGATRVVLLGGPGTLSDAVAKLTPCG
ncbi:cell wall-binding repeat-containing protein [Rathayibacter tritici]|uniref:Uncharacterized protein n=1 Tax=Rathayibacter tritici TaxID=33888 RepID=A0A160KT59_9MICO|nr:cell wall-binding repeat-containing protein [Rathayibacter tritici]AND16733.1 hypothetical protein A6122_1598 [Rathayibacter tritici]PPF67881.1 cell wall-binding repeat-containing protein [Rathayibacter tritici]PPG09527.1 cell wall-binding repeat-containing protein [Rathayibacter tritici]PPI43184.1 cell wall-binding repeat-containing protein [Rathayibacter tritici]